MLQQRRLLLAGLGFLGLALAGCSPEPAVPSKGQEGQKYKAGVDFLEVSSGLDRKVDGRVRVDEFFWYACPHCYTFKPKMERWKVANASKVKVHLAAVPLGVKWVPMSQAYYALEKLGFEQGLHDEIFKAWHEEKKDLNSLPSLLEVVRRSKGESYVQEFEAAYGSAEVLQKVEQIKALATKIGIESTPSVLVAGKYLLNTRQGHEHALGVMNYLVDMELAKP